MAVAGCGPEAGSRARPSIKPSRRQQQAGETSTMAYRKAAAILAGSCTVSAFQSTLLNRGIPLSSGQHNNLRRFSSNIILAMNSGPSFCEKCGTAMEIRIPHGDERERHVCGNSSCGYVSYQNPKVVVRSGHDVFCH